MKMNKHFLAITKKGSAARPILQGVAFDKETNKLNCTDSHRLISVDYNGTIENDMVLNIETMQQIEGVYPQIERLIPKANNGIITINGLDISTEFIKIVKVYKKQMLSLGFENDEIVISAHDLRDCHNGKEISRIKYSADPNHEKYEKIFFNAQYMIDLFECIKEYSTEQKKKNSDTTISITHIGRIRPMLFSMDGIRYLVTPIRTNY